MALLETRTALLETKQILPRAFSFQQNKFKKQNGLMIKLLLTEWEARRENIWPSVRTHEPRSARSVSPDLKPNIFPFGPLTQSISTQ